MYTGITSTPLGPVRIDATDKGIYAVSFGDDTSDASSHRLKCNNHVVQGVRELGEYFEGKRKEFTVSLDISGTVFQQCAWRELVRIPYGARISYIEQAMRMGNPRAVRAVGAANGANTIAIIIPCHRVVGKKGHLTGYSAGLDRKKWLLAHEHNNTYR